MLDRLRRDRSAMVAALDDPRCAIRDVGAAQARHLVRERVIGCVDASLARAGLEGMLVKGAALASSHYRPAWTRPMGDIDVLVRRQDAAAVLTALERAGLTQVDVGRPRTRASLGEQKLWCDVGRVSQLVEVHHDFDKIVPRPIDYDALRARACGVDGRRALTRPSDEDHVLLVALHASRSDFDHPPAWMDLAQLLTGSVDWDAIADRAARWQARVAMHVALRTLHALSPSRVPAGLVARFPLSRLRRRALEERYRLGQYPVLADGRGPGVPWLATQMLVRDAPMAWATGVARYAVDRLLERVGV